MALIKACEAKELFFKKTGNTENDLINYLYSKPMEEYFNMKIQLAIDVLNEEVYMIFKDKKILDNSYNQKTIKDYFESAGYQVCDFYIAMNNIQGVTIKIPLER